MVPPPSISPSFQNGNEDASTSTETTTSSVHFYLSVLCLAWYFIIWSICYLGLKASRAYHPPIPRSPLSSTSAPTRSDLSSNVQQQEEEEPIPGVSILRPLSGLDCNLYTNLCSSFEQQYHLERFEVILSVKDEKDQALNVARQVVERYPKVKSRIIIGDEDAGVNPKVNNLVKPYSLAEFDILWVIDSQVYLPPGALGRAVDSLTLPPKRPEPTFLKRSPHSSRVGLVHHVPLAVFPGPSWGSQVERAFLSTTHAKMYLAINSVSIDSCVMGKSNMYRKSDLEKVPDSFFSVGDGGSRGESGAIGSAAFETSSTTDQEESNTEQASKATIQTSSRALARFGIYLAEDNMLALSLWRSPSNLTHSLVPGDVAHTAVGDIRSLSDYARRRMRWIRVRRHMVPAATYAEPLTESVISGLMGLYAFRNLILTHLLDPPNKESYLDLRWSLCSLIFIGAHFVGWHLVDLRVLSNLSGGVPLPDHERVTFTQAWILRELLALPIWTWAMLGSTVLWRGKQYQILSDARAATISESSSSYFRRHDYSRLNQEEDVGERNVGSGSGRVKGRTD